MRGGFCADFRLDRLTLGAGGELGVLVVERATVNEHMGSLTFGLTGHVGADLVQWQDGRRIFLGVSPALHSLLASDTGIPLFVTGTLQLGYQL